MSEFQETESEIIRCAAVVITAIFHLGGGAHGRTET